jgi:hypothetical protein
MPRNLASRRVRDRKANSRPPITDDLIEKMFPEPRSPLIHAAFAAYKEYIESGGAELALDDINAEVAERRGRVSHCWHGN